MVQFPERLKFLIDNLLPTSLKVPVYQVIK